MCIGMMLDIAKLLNKLCMHLTVELERDEDMWIYFNMKGFTSTICYYCGRLVHNDRIEAAKMHNKGNEAAVFR